MNAKKQIFILWIVILLLIALMSYVYAISDKTDVAVTETEQCTISNPTWCEPLIEKNRLEYDRIWQETEKRQKELNNKNNVYRAIQKLDPNYTGETQESFQ